MGKEDVMDMRSRSKCGELDWVGYTNMLILLLLFFQRGVYKVQTRLCLNWGGLLSA